MSIEKYQKARDLISQVGGSFEGAKPESLVAMAEEALGLRFPPSYRRFLLELGCGDVNGLEVLGLIDDNFLDSSVPNGIWLTLNERQTSGLHSAYVIIGEGGDGTYIGIDTRQIDEFGESPVVRISVGEKNNEKIDDSFGDYFLKSVIQVL